MDLPPLLWGTGGEKPPDGGLGANPKAVERASARRGVGQPPHAGSSETGNRASIRTCSGRGVVEFRVHDLIQCSLWLGKGGMLLSCSRTQWPLGQLLTAHRSHPKVAVLTLHRSHPESSKLFHRWENL